MASRLKQNFLCDHQNNWNIYLASVIIMVSCNLCVAPSLRTNILFFLLSRSTGELLSTPKITTFLPQSKPEYETSAGDKNPSRYPEEEYLSESAFLVKLTLPNKQYF